MPTGPRAPKKGNFLHNRSQDSEFFNILMIELWVEEAKHNNFLVDGARYESCNKATLEFKGLRKKFLSHLKITLVRALSAKEVFASSTENND